MARLWTCGAELQTVTAAIEFTALITGAPVIETSIKRSGNAAYRISNAVGAEGFRQLHTLTQGPYYFRFYLYIVALPTLTAVIGGSRQTGANKAVIRLTATGALQLYNFEDSAQVGDDSSNLSIETWYRIEMMYDSTTLSATTCEARAYADTPGNTTPLWTASGTIDIAAVPNSFGCYNPVLDATLDYIVDDMAINDTTGDFQNSWCGEAKGQFAQRPNGNGSSSGWEGSDGNSTDNYLLIDETPPDTADYVQENTDETIDDYALEATPAAMESTDTATVVHVGVLAAVDDATGGDPNIALRFTAGGATDESATLDCNSTSYQGPAPLPANSNYQFAIYNMPGASTAAITKADLDAAEAGIRVDVGDTHFARVAALWTMVEYNAASAPAAVIPPKRVILNQAVERANL
jgi:hypothetical protein